MCKSTKIAILSEIVTLQQFKPLEQGFQRRGEGVDHAAGQLRRLGAHTAQHPLDRHGHAAAAVELQQKRRLPLRRRAGLAQDKPGIKRDYRLGVVLLGRVGAVGEVGAKRS